MSRVRGDFPASGTWTDRKVGPCPFPGPPRRRCPRADLGSRPAAPPTPGPVPVPRRPAPSTPPTPTAGSGPARRASCTSRAVVRAVARGGVITFRCGLRAGDDRDASRRPRWSTRAARVVLDGGGLVTLSGGGERRILYQNTCDPKQTGRPTTATTRPPAGSSSSTSRSPTATRTGRDVRRRRWRRDLRPRRPAQDRRLTFSDNRCDRTGPDLGGAAVRALSQHRGLPVYVVDSTFTGGRCSNGWALSSIGVSWSVYNRTLPGQPGDRPRRQPAAVRHAGRWRGGAIYADGNDFTVLVAGSADARTTAPARAAARSSSSATTAPATC